jgi:hypothetical protein
MYPKRHYNKWTINEILSLQREYELLKMNVTEIAKKHERSEDAILWKLEVEGFIEKNEIVQDTKSNDLLIKKEVRNVKQVKKIKINLNNRVEKLENSMNDMKELVKEVVNHFMEQKKMQYTYTTTKNKRPPLRRNQQCYL